MRSTYVAAAIAGPTVFWLYGHPTWAERSAIVHAGIAHLMPSVFLYLMVPIGLVSLAMAVTRRSFWSHSALEMLMSPLMCAAVLSLALYYHIESAAGLYGNVVLDGQAVLVGAAGAVGVCVAVYALVLGQPHGKGYGLARILHAAGLFVLAWCLVRMGADLYMTKGVSSAPSIAAMLAEMRLRALVLVGAAALLGGGEAVRRWRAAADEPRVSS